MGELSLRYETLRVPEPARQTGQELHVFIPDDQTAQVLRLLASWTAPAR